MLRLVIVFIFCLLIIKLPCSIQADEDMGSWYTGFVSNGRLESNLFLKDSSGVSFDVYMLSNFNDYQYYDFDLRYSFKFPFEIGLYNRFSNSYKPGTGIAMGFPFEINNNFFSPSLKIFYDTLLNDWGFNINMIYSYDCFSLFLESDFFAKTGFDFFLIKFFFQMIKNLGFYTGWNISRFELDAGEKHGNYIVGAKVYFN